ncbi:DUF262 domain-containing protein [Roseibium sp. RP-7]
MSEGFGYLDIANHPPKTLRWWYSHRNEVDMSPPYQRKGRLWSQSDKAYLIDSIINGFDIPKIYLADFRYRDSTLNEKRLPYAIIDGKQRYEAVIDFFENKVVLNEDFIWRKKPKLKLGGLSYRDLEKSHPDVAEAFENESWTVMSVVSDREEEINELFVRLNRSKSLTGSEVRNAMSGPVSEVIRKAASHPFFEETIKFSTKRMNEVNAAAKLILFEYYGKLAGTKKSDLDKFARDKNVDPDRLELSGIRVMNNLDVMQEVFLPKDPLLSSSGMVPVYYWLVRNQDTMRIHLLREFLVDFERRRKLNRDQQKANPNSHMDPVFSRFDALNRNTNDIGGHMGRYELLRDEFEKW